MARRNYPFEANLALDDAGAAHSAAGWSTVGGAQAIADLGGNQGIVITLPSISAVPTLTPQQARLDAVCVIYNVAGTFTGSNVYRIDLVGSNNPGMLAGNVILGGLVLGQGAGMDPPNCANTTTPLGPGGFPAGWQYELLFTNEFQNTPYEFVSLWVAGTFGSITFNAFISVLPRE